MDRAWPCAECSGSPRAVPRMAASVFGALNVQADKALPCSLGPYRWTCRVFAGNVKQVASLALCGREERALFQRVLDGDGLLCG